MKKVVGLLVLFGLVSSVNSYASDVWEAAQSSVYKEKAPAQLGRGLLNVGTCFVDMFVQAANGAKEAPQAFGAVGGFAKGAMCTILRASSGVIDVATFWVPGFNGLPVCRGYDDCITCSPAAQAPAAPVYTAPAPSQPAPITIQSEPVQAQPKSEDRMKYIKK